MSSGPNPMKHGSTKQFKSAYKEVEMGCIKKYIFISVLHLLTLLGRVRFGVGQWSATFTA